MIAAVAGRAWRTPLGNSIEGVTSRLLAGEYAVQRASHAAPGACQLRCRIPDRPASSRNERFLDRLGLLALEAGRDAMVDAGFTPGDSRLDRTALFTATGGLRPRWNELVPALLNQRDDGARFSLFRRLRARKGMAHRKLATPDKEDNRRWIFSLRADMRCVSSYG